MGVQDNHCATSQSAWATGSIGSRYCIGVPRNGYRRSPTVTGGCTKIMISTVSPARSGRLLTVSVPSCVSVVSMRYACMGVPSTNDCTHIIPLGAATEKDEKNKSPSYPKYMDSTFASFLIFLGSSQDGLSYRRGRDAS